LSAVKPDLLKTKFATAITGLILILGASETNAQRRTEAGKILLRMRAAPNLQVIDYAGNPDIKNLLRITGNPDQIQQ
jgi:hypothetical protein